jgi:hypothetical protein
MQVSGLWILLAASVGVACLLAGVAQMILHSARRVVRARTFQTGVRQLRKLTSWNREAGGGGRGQLQGASSKHELGELEAGAAAAANGGGHSTAGVSWRQAGAAGDRGCGQPTQQQQQQQGVAAEPLSNAELAAALDDVLAAVRRMEKLLQQAGQGSATPG